MNQREHRHKIYDWLTAKGVDVSKGTMNRSELCVLLKEYVEGIFGEVKQEQARLYMRLSAVAKNAVNKNKDPEGKKYLVELRQIEEGVMSLIKNIKLEAE